MIGLGDIWTVGKGALGLAQSPVVKLAIIAGMLATVIGWYEIQLARAADLARAECQVEHMTAARKDREERIKSEAERLAAVNKNARDANERAAVLQEKLDNRPKVKQCQQCRYN